MLAPNLSQDQYNFAAAPRVVKARTKYRELTAEDQEFVQTTSNLMWDRRVVRGNTYAAIVTTSREAAKQYGPSQTQTKRRTVKPLETDEHETVQADVSTPRAIEGRKHAQIYTDENVELLTDKPPKYEKDAQTDFHIERPVKRLYMPEKIGEDRETQIWDGELFHFDYEVEPILQVLVGKTLEQGRMEVLEEEELRVMREEQKRYDELRYAEMAEAQRMLDEEKKKLEENERRKKQHKAKKDQVVVSHQKMISRILAKEYLKNVRTNSLGILREQGTFQNIFDLEFNNSFLPWIFRDIIHLRDNRGAIANTIRATNELIAKNLADNHAQAVHTERERRRIAKEERERIEAETKERRQKRAELRKKRDEEERRRVLQERIEELLVSKGETKQGIVTQVLSDLDALGREGQTVGLFGGLIGEIVVVLSAIADLKQAQPEDPLASLKSIEVTKDTIQKIVSFLLDELLSNAKVEVGVSGDVEARLEAIDPELNLDNLHTAAGKAKELKEFLSASINSFVLKTLQENAEQASLRVDYIPLIIEALVNHILNPEESARNVKLVKAPLDYSEDPRFEALAVFLPNVTEFNLFNLAELKGVKQPPPKPGKKDSTLNEGDTARSARTGEGEEKIPVAAEVEFDDEVHVFPIQSEELRVLVHHKVAANLLRREILLFLSSVFKELDMKEIEVLKRVNEKAESLEAIVAGKFSKDLTVLTFDRS